MQSVLLRTQMLCLAKVTSSGGSSMFSSRSLVGQQPICVASFTSLRSSVAALQWRATSHVIKAGSRLQPLPVQSRT